MDRETTPATSMTTLRMASLSPHCERLRATAQNRTTAADASRAYGDQRHARGGEVAPLVGALRARRYEKVHYVPPNISIMFAERRRADNGGQPE